MPDRSLLTENQARHLRIYLSRLVAEAEAMREWSERIAPQPDWVRAVQAELERLAQAGRDIAARFGLDLESREVDPRRRVSAWAGLWWASVLDCRPRALRGYGPVGPELEQALGPAIEEMAAHLRRIGSLASEGRDEQV